MNTNLSPELLPHIAFQLQARRKELNLSYHSLSMRLKFRGLNIQPRILSAWESGSKPMQISKPQLLVLADALHCTVDDLISTPID